MSLKKVSHGRVAEELSRGFDILTNGDLRGGLAKIEATGYMKQAPKAWDRISPTARDNKEGGAAADMTQQEHLDF